MYCSFNRKNLQEENIDLENFRYSKIPHDETGINWHNTDGIYVKIPVSDPLSIVNIETGYFNRKTKEKYINRIVWNNVTINGIYAVISRTANGKYKQYHYRIELSVSNYSKDKQALCPYTDNYKELVYGGKDLVDLSSTKCYENMHTIKNLFKIHLANIYFSFTNGITCKNIDFSKYLKEQSVTLEDRICNILKNIKLSEYNKHKYLCIDAKLADTWITNILAKSFDVKPCVDYQQTHYMYEVQELKDSNDMFFYKKECIYNLLYNYNVSDDILLKFIALNEIDNFEKGKPYSKYPSSYKQKLDCFFDFIYSIKSEKRIEGFYRVGRDDKEKTIEKVSFDLKDFTPSERLVNEINSILKIELKKNDNNTISWSYEEMEAVAGLAKSHDYTASYQIENIFKLECFFIRTIIKNGTDWLIDNYKI